MIKAILLGVVILLTLLVFILPDYSEEYAEEISKNIKMSKELIFCKENATNISLDFFRYKRNQSKDLSLCPKCEMPICEEAEFSAADKQRYIIRIKELEYYLNEINDTDLYMELKRNHTNLQQEYLECNQTRTKIIGLLNI